MKKGKSKIQRVMAIEPASKELLDNMRAQMHGQKINSIELGDLMLMCVVGFCENAAELGCPRDKAVDIWIRELEADHPKKAQKVMNKLIDIFDRDYR